MDGSRNSPFVDLPGRVAAFFLPRLASGRRVCVAFSGGRDSVALLHLLAGLRHLLPGGLQPFELSAIHVHHGLSANADKWADFCVNTCRQLNVPLQVVRVNVTDTLGEGLEAAARSARYAAFREYTGNAADWLALAHHRDDQAETLLLNLLRGAGTEGLAAMPEERPLAAAADMEGSKLRLVRPLLGVGRREIEDWLQQQGLAWIEDESNTDSRLRRNFLRNKVMPLLSEVFPQPATALARVAGRMAESSALAEELAANDAIGIVEGQVLHLHRFNQLSSMRRANLLRMELRRRGWRMPDARYLAEILRQLATAAEDAAPAFPVEGGALRVYRGCLHFCQPAPLPSHVGHAIPAAPCLWSGEAALPWAGGVLRFEHNLTGAGLSLTLLQGAVVSVRFRQGGESFQPYPGRPRRPLKKLLQEAGIPAWQRHSLPLIYCGDTLVWVAGIGSDVRYVARSGEPAVVPVWEPAASH